MLTTRIEEIHEKFKKLGLPDYMWGGVQRYLEHKIEPGSFLLSVLENAPFTEVIARADVTNQSLLREWGLFCYNDLPGWAWGSKEKVQAWLTLKGLVEDDA